MKRCSAILIAGALLLPLGCKDKRGSPSAVADASLGAGAFSPSSKTSLDAGRSSLRPPTEGAEGVFGVEALAVSSRAESDTGQPAFLGDDDLNTAWSSKTGDLEGAWVQMRFGDRAGTMHGVAMTVGMTKKTAFGSAAGKKDDDDDSSSNSSGGDLFLQNPRIAEVSIALNDAVLVESFKLDPERRELQTIPFSETTASGVLRITVKKVRMGTKPAYREVSISEIKLLRRTRPLPLRLRGAYVGTLDPKARGLLGIIPERSAPLRCLAFVPGAALRVYCVLGYTANLGASRLNGGELVAIDKTGSKTIAPLAELPTDGFLYQVPYGAWLRTERELTRGKGKTLVAQDNEMTRVPWDGSVVVNGATFRQRETMREPKDAPPGAFDLINGVLEVNWPGDTTFISIFGVSPNIAPSQRMTATVRPIEHLWLVERHMDHGSEGTNAEGAEASLCDFAAKKCTSYAVPTPEAKDD